MLTWHLCASVFYLVKWKWCYLGFWWAINNIKWACCLCLMASHPFYPMALTVPYSLRQQGQSGLANHGIASSRTQGWSRQDGWGHDPNEAIRDFYEVWCMESGRGCLSSFYVIWYKDIGLGLSVALSFPENRGSLKNKPAHRGKEGWEREGERTWQYHWDLRSNVPVANSSVAFLVTEVTRSS